MNLRLILTKKCNRSCVGCCNNDFDLDSLPYINTFYGYNKIIITGGEPMLYIEKLKTLIVEIRKQNKKAEIIVYTAKTKRASDLIDILYLVDGLTITLHEKYDIEPFFYFAGWVLAKNLTHKLLRVNIFKNVGDVIKLDDWSYKTNIEWIKNCPVPRNEILAKYW